MAINPMYPGVYVQERSSGVRTINAVSTSIGCFIGRTLNGPLGQPIRIQNPSDFARTFGDDSSLSDMARYVKLFFLNGGSDCYVTRIANNAQPSTVTLKNEGGNATLALQAKNAGVLGDTVRLAVNYNTQYPEVTFNMEVFRWVTDSRGKRVQQDRELWSNLSMDPSSSSYAPDVLSQKSKLISAKDELLTPASAGFSQSGLPIPYASGAFPSSLVAAIGSIFGSKSPAKRFRISVDGSAFVELNITADLNLPAQNFSGVNSLSLLSDLYKAAFATLFSQVLPAGVQVDATLVQGPASSGPMDSTAFFRFTSAKKSPGNADVFILPATTDDAATPMMLGTGQGGIEVGTFAPNRPAPSGLSLAPFAVTSLGKTVLDAFGALTQKGVDQLTEITLDEFDSTGALVPAKVPLSLDDAPFVANTRNWNGPGGVRAKLGRWRDSVNLYQSNHAATFRWQAQLWGYRLAFVPTLGDDDTIPSSLSTSQTDFSGEFIKNSRYYALGAGTPGNFKTPGNAGNDGGPPKSKDYDDAYEIIDNEVDLFNLLVLPPDHGNAAVSLSSLYGAASVFCQRRRAFLIMDPPDDWDSPQSAASKVDNLRIGLVKDYSAVYYPRLTVNEDARQVTVGPAGAMAGLYARTDNNRGVWKAPAGTEASLQGIAGLDLRMSDPNNGIINPVGVNALRIFPDGVVSWGARTNDGADSFASEYKYIPVRRLALFIEESLYRGLKWVVFEPNDPALWSQIRLNVGAFMNGLFRQGAFQGKTAKESYFVKCDDETTTQNDQNLGIVNIQVGFAPPKPAEFVVLYLQQMAGQIQT